MKQIVRRTWFLLIACVLAGCASTSIERDAAGFRYFSDKNISLEGLEIDRQVGADGSVHEKIMVKKAGGDASGVNAGWQAVIDSLVRRIPVAPVPAP